LKKTLFLLLILLGRFCDAGTLFVVLQGGQIAVVDTQTKKVINLINNNTGPAGITISPNGKRLFALSIGGDIIASYNTQTFGNIFTATNVGPGYRAGYAPDNLTLYIPIPTIELNTLGVFTNTLIDTISLSGPPLTTLVHPTLPKAFSVYFATISTSQVGIINTSTRSETSTINLGGAGNNMGMTSDGSLLAVPLPNEDSVEIIDTTTEAVTTVSVGLGPYDAVFDNNGYLYVSNNTEKTVSIIDLSTNTVVYTYVLPLTSNPLFLTYAPDENKIYVSNFSINGSVDVLNGMPNPSLDGPIEQVGVIPNGIAYMSINTFMVFGNSYQ